MPSGSPPASAASAARMAARSAPVRSTGKPPSAERNVADHPYFHSSAFPMNRIRRRVTQARNGVSRNDRWDGARTQAPRLGTRSRCTTLIRHISRQTNSTNHRTKSCPIPRAKPNKSTFSTSIHPAACQKDIAQKRSRIACMGEE